MIRAVIIGFAHMHVNEIALYLHGQPDFELAGIADAGTGAERVPPLRYTPAWNLKNVAEKYCSRVYGDYRQMLDELKPDLAFLLCENARKPEIAEECAKRRVSLCIEKPMAVSYGEALKIAESVKKYGVEAVVNWPVIWRPYLHRMQRAAESGLVGRPVELRYLNGHTGPLGKGAKHRGVTEAAEEMTDAQRAMTWWHRRAEGGGVFLDIGCYGCLFTDWVMGGGALSALAYGANLNTPFGDTEDNFAAVIRYPDRMSVIEGTWTTPRCLIPAGPTILCTEGVITCTGSPEGQPEVAACDLYGNAVAVPELTLGDEYRNMPWHYAHHAETGAAIQPMASLGENLRIMAMLDAVIRSGKSGRAEAVQE